MTATEYSLICLEAWQLQSGELWDDNELEWLTEGLTDDDFRSTVELYVRQRSVAAGD